MANCRHSVPKRVPLTCGCKVGMAWDGADYCLQIDCHCGLLKPSCLPTTTVTRRRWTLSNRVRLILIMHPSQQWYSRLELLQTPESLLNYWPFTLHAQRVSLIAGTIRLACALCVSGSRATRKNSSALLFALCVLTCIGMLHLTLSIQLLNKVARAQLGLAVCLGRECARVVCCTPPSDHGMKMVENDRKNS
jgi:hypothetical protein